MPSRALTGVLLAVAGVAVLAGCRAAAERPLAVAGSPAAEESRTAPGPVAEAIRWEDGLSLEELLGAVESHPRVRAAGLGVDGAGARLDAAGTWRNRPELEVEGTAGLDGDGGSVEVRISQTFELGGQSSARKRAAGASVAGATADAAGALLEARSDARIRYFAAVAAQRELELARQDVALADRTVEVAQARLDAGQVAAIDVSLARVRAGRARAAVSEAEGEFQATLAEVGYFVPGAPAGWTLAAQAAPSPAAIDEARAIAIALDRRWDVALLQARALEAEARADLADSEGTPDLTVGLGYEFERGRIEGDGVDIRESSHSAILSVGLPLPLWNPSRGEAAEARAEARKAQAEALAVQSRIVGEVRAASRRMAAAAASLELYNSEVLPVADSNLEVVRAGYASGELAISDLLRAQEDRQEVVAEAIRARAAFEIRRAELEAAVGAPLAEFAK